MKSFVFEFTVIKICLKCQVKFVFSEYWLPMKLRLHFHSGKYSKMMNLIRIRHGLVIGRLGVGGGGGVKGKLMLNFTSMKCVPYLHPCGKMGEGKMWQNV